MEVVTTEYQKKVSEFINKLVIVFGPTYVFTKLTKVNGLAFLSDGTLDHVDGSPSQIIQAILSEFSHVPHSILKKIASPILTYTPTADGVNASSSQPHAENSNQQNHMG